METDSLSKLLESKSCNGCDWNCPFIDELCKEIQTWEGDIIKQEDKQNEH
jgi:hypothetical protein